jgi:hypothetical protein
MGDTYMGFYVGDVSLDNVSHVGIVVVDVDLLLTSGEDEAAYYIYKV